jgi:hypothetical protein
LCGENAIGVFGQDLKKVKSIINRVETWPPLDSRIKRARRGAIGVLKMFQKILWG